MGVRERVGVGVEGYTVHSSGILEEKQQKCHRHWCSAGRPPVSVCGRPAVGLGGVLVSGTGGQEG